MQKLWSEQPARRTAEHTLTTALDETFEWMKRAGLDKSFEWDWQHEDDLLEKLRDMPGVH